MAPNIYLMNFMLMHTHTHPLMNLNNYLWDVFKCNLNYKKEIKEGILNVVNLSAKNALLYLHDLKDTYPGITTPASIFNVFNLL